jgi:hypothetical protein
MALFRKKANLASDSAEALVPRVEWHLEQLIARVRDEAPALEARDIDAALVHARLADQYRDLGLAPPNVALFEQNSANLDVEGWRRLALAVAILDDAALLPALLEIAPRVPVAVQVENGFLAVARETAPLTVALVRQSAIRAQEFGRHLAMRLGFGIAGESLEQSRAILKSLDYKRLLTEADVAKAAAQEKMERLRQKQMEADMLRRRRGKI